jgi:nitrile hydratase
MNTTIGALGHHDVGGADALLAGKLPRDRAYAYWERELHALLVHLVRTGKMTVDALRSGQERLEPSMYSRLTYYERWTASIVNRLIENGDITRAEIEAALGPPVPAGVFFSIGDHVVVAMEGDVRRWRKPHLRVPGYLHGARGVVTQVVGAFEDPAYAAFHETAPAQVLYRVEFPSAQVWGSVEMMRKGDEANEANGTITADVFQPWLVPASAAPVAPVAPPPPYHGKVATGCTPDAAPGADHSHLPRGDVECKAAASDPGAVSMPLQPLAAALVNVLDRKGLAPRDALRKIVESMDAHAGPHMLGPKIVARAWRDPAFKAALLQDCAKAVKKYFGRDTSNYAAVGDVTFYPPSSAAAAAAASGGAAEAAAIKKTVELFAAGHTVLQVVANTATTHNLIVCTLCSCYPTNMLGMSPEWYKNTSFRARAVRAPRKLLREEFGLTIDESIKIAVHDSTAELRYFVLPQRPAGTDGWSEAKLEALATRDCLLGVAVPSTVINAPSKL